ncbi:MAG TPA: hypothetical protein PKC18_15040, partial [Lacipirellulaceae bacterium]|nr:hypothetical protein [Lacipirellulaceae bacterium]
AFSPVVAAPTTVVVQRPGLLDRWRMRRWGVTAPGVMPAPTFVAAPTMMTAAPHVAAFTPTFATAVTPHVSAFAPLQTTTFRPAVLTPVVAAPACTTCAFTPAPCDPCATAVACPTAACDACSAAVAPSSVIQPASFAAPSSGCASCNGATQFPSSTSGDPVTPQPTIPMDVGSPLGSGYPGSLDPIPAVDSGAASGLQAPPLAAPVAGRTASRPSVDIHPAVYRRPATTVTASTSASAAAPQRAVDAASWDSTPAGR